MSTVTDKKIYDGDWKGMQVIVKVNMSWFEEFEKRKSITNNHAVESFEKELQSRVSTLFGDCPRCAELALLLATLGDGNSDGVVSGSEARTFISLLQFIEPTMLMILNDSKHTVDFYGYCGGLYALEKVPKVVSKEIGADWEPVDISFLSYGDPFQEMLNEFLRGVLNAVIFAMQYCCAVLNDALNLTRYHIFTTFFQMLSPSKREKFELAYSMLDATLEISNNPFGLVRQCDGHLGNFGITNNASVKIIDLDLTYPHVFLRTLLEQTKCVSDEECWAGNSEACFSSCNTSSGFCTPTTVVQDVHIICEVLFPIIFRGPNILEPQGHNTTFLTKAISKLGLFCSKLPVANTIEDLRREILSVKRRLKTIEIKSSKKF